MAAELKQQGNEAFKAGRYQEAINYYTQAIQLDPNNETLYSYRAASYSGLNQNQQAMDDANRCIQLKPDWVKGYFRCGVAQAKLHQYDEAAKSFTKALDIDPNNTDIQTKLSEARAELKRWQESKHPARETDTSECKRMGNSLFKEGKIPEAIEWYTRAIDLTKANPTEETAMCYTNRAACYAQNHQHELVVADATSAIEINPQYTKAYLRRAMACEGLEKWKKAAEDYKKANELQPGSGSEGYHRAQKFAKDMM